MLISHKYTLILGNIIIKLQRGLVLWRMAVYRLKNCIEIRSQIGI